MSDDRYIEGDALVGKTVAHIHRPAYASELTLVFTDGTYTRVVANGSSDGSADLDFERGGDFELAEAGLITQDEYAARKARQDAECQERQRRHRLAMFERLKAEFDPQPKQD